jgi:hypothetical protein
MIRNCTVCQQSTQGRGWSLSGYHGLSGTFCADCYDKVSHDSQGQARRPLDYLRILLTHGDANGKH